MSQVPHQSIFSTAEPHIAGNELLRRPQRLAYEAIMRHFAGEQPEREIGVVLPVGCGKSGTMTVVPYGLKPRRVLVIAPNLNIADQLLKDFDRASGASFYHRVHIVPTEQMPEVAEIRGAASNVGDLEHADVVVTNIQQLARDRNAWLDALDPAFFDLIMFDEAHHNVAESWDRLREKFPAAKIVNFSATPVRADGRAMEGKIVYSFPVAEAMRDGYVKHLRASVLSPRTLKYVRRQDGVEVEVDLDEVRRLGEEEADFRRSIVSSKESLATIVAAGIVALNRIRESTGDNRHKIIVSALNYEHCAQVVAAFSERGMRADYVHSRDVKRNETVLRKLENDELDVIVQVRKLGEGFDHKYLSVAVVCSVFGNLGPFVQFVGRIMRVVVQNAPNHVQNNGVVVFHAGSNIASVWDDFRNFSQADQTMFSNLLPKDVVVPEGTDSVEIDPLAAPAPRPVGPAHEITVTDDIALLDVPLLDDDPEAAKAFELLLQRGMTSEMFAKAEMLTNLPVSRQKSRRAAKTALDRRVVVVASGEVSKRGLSPMGYDLDGTARRRINMVVLKTAIDRRIWELVERGAGERAEFSIEDYQRIDAAFEEIVADAVAEVFDGAA